MAENNQILRIQNFTFYILHFELKKAPFPELLNDLNAAIIIIFPAILYQL